MSFLSIFSSDDSNANNKNMSSRRQSESNGGDNGAFLRQLINILENPSREDNTPLSLNASAIEYVALFIDRSREIGVNALTPTNKQNVRKLERLLLQVQHLCVNPSRSLRRIDFSAFAALQVLEVSGISVSCLENHVSLRAQLKSFKFEKYHLDSVASLLAPGLSPMLPNSRSRRRSQAQELTAEEEEAEKRLTEAATHGKNSFYSHRANRLSSMNVASGLLPFPSVPKTTTGVDGNEVVLLDSDEEDNEEEEWKAFQWHKLSKLVLNECELADGLSDGMLRLAWQVRVVELRGNRLTTVEKIFHHCELLEHLDLSHNLLRSLPMLHLSLGNVSVLILSSNHLTSTFGLDRLYSLTEADLGFNHIRDINEIRRLSSLPNLEALWLRGNPLAIGDNEKLYRSRVFKVFIEFGDRGGAADYPSLDGIPVNAKERAELAKQSFVRATKVTGATSSFKNRESFSLSEQPINTPSMMDRGANRGRWGGHPSFSGGPIAHEGATVVNASFSHSFSEMYHDLRESFSGNSSVYGGGGERDRDGSFSSNWESRHDERTRGRQGSFGSSFNGSFSVWEPGQDHRRRRSMSGSSSNFNHQGSFSGFNVLDRTSMRDIPEPVAAVPSQKRRRRRKRTVEIEDMPDKFLQEEIAKAAALLDGYVEDNRPTPMLYTTTYVPPPIEVSKARAKKRSSISSSLKSVNSPRSGKSALEDDDDDDDDTKTTLADEILAMPESQVKNVAKCRRCGCLLPSDMEALEKHQEECNGSHFLATSRAMSRQYKEEDEARSSSGEESDDDVDYTPTSDDMHIQPEPAKSHHQEDDDNKVIPWSQRLEVIGDNLRCAVTVVKVHRYGKRLLRKSLRGNEAITWLLENHPEGCRDEEQAWVLGRTMIDNGILMPLFHEDSFRLAALNYRFTRDHEQLLSAASTEVFDAVANQNMTGDGEVAKPMFVTAADYGQFDEALLTDMVEKMRQSISVKTRVPYRSIASVAQAAGCYRRCFKGCDAVEWMIKSSEAIDENEALEVGHALIWNGLIYPCVSSGKKSNVFEDSKTAYFRFSHAWIRRKVIVSSNKPHKKNERKDKKPKTYNDDDDEDDEDDDVFERKSFNSSEGSEDIEEEEEELVVNKEEDRVVYEEALTPANIVALGRRLRSVPGLVKDREDQSISSSAYSIISGLITDENDDRESIMVSSSSSALLNDHEVDDGDAVDVEVAFPLTFFGSEAISWMMNTYGLIDEEDALVIGDLLLHHQVIKEVEAAPNKESLRESLGLGGDSNQEEKNSRGFQNKKCYYRFIEDDVRVAAEIAERERRMKALEDRVNNQIKSGTKLVEISEEIEANSDVNSDFDSDQASANYSDDEYSFEVDRKAQKRQGGPGLGLLQHQESSGMVEWEAAAVANSAPATPLPTANAGSSDRVRTYSNSSSLAEDHGELSSSPNHDDHEARSSSTPPPSDSLTTKTTVEVRIPIGVKEGDVIEFNVGNGQTARATMPKGVKGGHKMKILVNPDATSVEDTELGVDEATATTAAEANQVSSNHLDGGEYVGDEGAGEFILADDFEMYLRIQIFAPNQSSACRLTYRVTPSNGTPARWGAMGTSPIHCGHKWKDEELIFAKPFPIVPWKISKPIGMAHIFNEVPRLTVEGVEGKDVDVNEAIVWMAVTTSHVYLFENPAIYDGKNGGDGLLSRKFNSCPRPVVLRRFPILALESLTIGFFFQSALLMFSESSTNVSVIDPSFSGSTVYESNLQPTPPASLQVSGGFVLLTRDKVHTSSLLGSIGDAVNKARQRCRPPITEHISPLNSDDMILNELSNKLNISAVSVYQPLFQRWKSRLGVLAPRTLLMSDDMLYLCHEDHGSRSSSSRFTVLDSAPLKDISAVSSSPPLSPPG